MNPDVVLGYSTEGGIHLLADLDVAALWRGVADDGSGVTVDYMGAAVVKLPDQFLKVRKPGRHTKKFATMAEAESFVRDMLAAFEKAAPEATRPRPDQPIYNIGTARAFSVDISFHTMLDSVRDKMKGDLAVMPVDKKAKKAEAIFFDVEDGGRGYLVADAKAGIVAITKLHHAGEHDKSTIGKAVAALRPPKGKATVKLGGRLLFFPAGFSAAEVSGANWKGGSLMERAVPLFDGNADAGSLAVPDQNTGGAFVRMPAGDYAVTYKADGSIGDIGANILWCVRT